MRFIWYSPGALNPAKAIAAGFPPTVHTGFTARDPDCDEDPFTNGVDGNPNPVPYRTISSLGWAGVVYPGYRLAGPK
jgi:hypothetical protein